MTRFQWRALVQAALGAGVPLREAWQLTPAELAFLLGRDLSVAPLSRARLSELAAAFPDMRKDQSDG
ncbi:MAG: phage tail assembly chaperone [Pseudomonadota bacterium]